MKKGATFQFHNQTDTLEIHITDVIDNFWGYGKTEFLDEITKTEASKVNVIISSPGGNVDDALAIYDFMKGYNGEVNTFLTGIVASAATIIALGGKSVTMSENALFMIHNVSSGAWGTAKDMRDTADVIDMVEARIIDIYAEKTGMSKDEIQKLLDAETWMSATSAKELGFIDVVSKNIETTNKVDAKNLIQYGFANFPQGCYNLINYDNKSNENMENDKKEIGLLLKLENLLNKVLGNKVDPKDPIEGEGENAEEFHTKITEISNKIEVELQNALTSKIEAETKLAEIEAAKDVEIANLKNEIAKLEGKPATNPVSEEALPGQKKELSESQMALKNLIENKMNSLQRAEMARNAEKNNK